MIVGNSFDPPDRHGPQGAEGHSRSITDLIPISLNQHLYGGK